MRNDIVARVAFALQDDGMSRLQAQRIARAAISAIQAGDRLGRGLVVAPDLLASGAFRPDAICIPPQTVDRSAN